MAQGGNLYMERDTRPVDCGGVEVPGHLVVDAMQAPDNFICFFYPFSDKPPRVHLGVPEDEMRKAKELEAAKDAFFELEVLVLTGKKGDWIVEINEARATVMAPGEFEKRFRLFVPEKNMAVASTPRIAQSLVGAGVAFRPEPTAQHCQTAH